MATNNKEKPPKAIFFDAAGTLFHLSGTVGHHYALVGNEVGLTLDAHHLDARDCIGREKFLPHAFRPEVESAASIRAHNSVFLFGRRHVKQPSDRHIQCRADLAKRSKRR